jgi:hypothetical protein
MNNKAQMGGGLGMIIGIIFLFMTIVVLVGFLPAINEMIYEQRGQTSLNCVSSKNVCGAGQLDTYCYNSTKDSDTTSCTIFSIYTPFILIVVLVGGVGGILYGRSVAPPQQQGYGY